MVYNIVCDNIVPSAIDVESHLPPAGQRLLTSAGGGRRGVSGGRLHVRGARALGHRSAHGAAIAQRGWPWRRLPKKASLHFRFRAARDDSVPTAA